MFCVHFAQRFHSALFLGGSYPGELQVSPLFSALPPLGNVGGISGCYRKILLFAEEGYA